MADREISLPERFFAALLQSIFERARIHIVHEKVRPRTDLDVLGLPPFSLKIGGSGHAADR
jgi:hypothetical protein